MSLRKYFVGQARTAAEMNKPWEDMLTSSGYLADGSDFAGFMKAGVLPSLAVGGKASISGQARIGDLFRVESIITPDVSSLTGAGVEVTYDPTNFGVIRSYDYTASALRGLTLSASSLGAGKPARTDVGVENGYTTTGNNIQAGYRFTGVFDDQCTVRGSSYVSFPSTKAAAFTLPTLNHYTINDVTVGAGSSVTQQNGYFCPQLANGGTNYAAEFTNSVRADWNTNAGESRFMLWDVTAGTLRRVKIGAANTGPTGGQQMLYV